ncbi:ANTAR domain-containing protein [Humibacillus xanthopallidus]|uniref:ANTAR domain-containing protein n=1 Tax=Humibacillus xanthopallidus TaxID=412689 RepID=A0A543HHS5_9MICO|nr:ANTAR domain-containing protein [Humibacillus xanthopallidus]TQM57883.1 ANTAR domain-containing protein [Humibacillus xanthopallidus]
MSGRREHDERDWAAEKRDFVADRRDDLADARDAAADLRDAVADARDLAMDDREKAFDQYQHAQGSAAPTSGPARTCNSPPAASMLSLEKSSRQEARLAREERAAERDIAALERAAAATRRMSTNASTQLAAVFAEIAAQLHADGSFDQVLQHIAETAVATVTGCAMASVTLSHHSLPETAATTSPAASAVDQAQYEAGEGPCLDALVTPMVSAASFPDSRWPRLGARPAALGAGSAASYRLTFDSSRSGGLSGSLNTYGKESNAYTDEATHIGIILAAHASVAGASVRERSELEHLADNLSTALLSRDVIGQAKGILMERLKLTPEEAFDALRHSSQHLNEKLRLVAERLAQTGEFDEAEAAGP